MQNKTNKMKVEYEKYLEYKEIISKNEPLLTSEDTETNKNNNNNTSSQNASQ
jgi:hypothetical protein